MKLFFLLINLFFCTISIAQTPPSIEWGAEEHKSYTDAVYFQALIDDYAYVYNLNRRDFTLFDTAWNLKHKVKLPEGFIYRSIIETQSGHYSLLFKNNEIGHAEGKWALYQQKIDQEFFQTPKVLQHIDIRIPKTMKTSGRKYSLHVKVNAAKNRVVVATTMDKSTHKGPAVYDISVYNEDLKLLWRKKQEFPYADYNLKLS